MKAILLPIGVVAFSIICLAQSDKSVKPDLTGTWEIDAARSGRDKSETSPEQIRITQHDPEFIIHRKVTIKGAPAHHDFIYYTDARGEKNPAIEGLTTEPYSEAWRSKETESTTSWDKDKLVTRSVSRSFESGVIFEAEITHEWRLSSDGKTLTENIRTVPNRTAGGNGSAVAGHGVEYKNVYKLISK